MQRELSGQESRCGIVVFMCDGDGVVEGVEGLGGTAWAMISVKV